MERNSCGIESFCPGTITWRDLEGCCRAEIIKMDFRKDDSENIMLILELNNIRLLKGRKWVLCKNRTVVAFSWLDVIKTLRPHRANAFTFTYPILGKVKIKKARVLN